MPVVPDKRQADELGRKMLDGALAVYGDELKEGEEMKKFIPQTFNDLLALVLIGLIFVLWILTGCGVMDVPEVVLGATISGWTAIILFYFRKKTTESG